MFFRERARIGDLAFKHRLPSMTSAYRDLRTTFGYGPNLDDMCRRAADYADKILNGAQSGNLPVEQPTKFELVINLKRQGSWPHDPAVRAGPCDRVARAGPAPRCSSRAGR